MVSRVEAVEEGQVQGMLDDAGVGEPDRYGPPDGRRILLRVHNVIRGKCGTYSTYQK